MPCHPYIQSINATSQSPLSQNNAILNPDITQSQYLNVHQSPQVLPQNSRNLNNPYPISNLSSIPVTAANSLSAMPINSFIPPTLLSPSMNGINSQVIGSNSPPGTISQNIKQQESLTSSDYMNLIKCHNFWFLKQFFSRSFDLYHTQLVEMGTLRSDLRNHPLQQYYTHQIQLSPRSQTTSAVNDSTGIARINDPLQGDAKSLWQLLVDAVTLLTSQYDSVAEPSQDIDAASNPVVVAGEQNGCLTTSDSTDTINDKIVSPTTVPNEVIPIVDSVQDESVSQSVVADDHRIDQPNPVQSVVINSQDIEPTQPSQDVMILTSQSSAILPGDILKDSAFTKATATYQPTKVISIKPRVCPMIFLKLLPKSSINESIKSDFDDTAATSSDSFTDESPQASLRSLSQSPDSSTPLSLDSGLAFKSNDFISSISPNSKMLMFLSDQENDLKLLHQQYKYRIHRLLSLISVVFIAILGLCGFMLSEQYSMSNIFFLEHRDDYKAQTILGSVLLQLTKSSNVSHLNVRSRNGDVNTLAASEKIMSLSTSNSPEKSENVIEKVSELNASFISILNNVSTTNEVMNVTAKLSEQRLDDLIGPIITSSVTHWIRTGGSVILGPNIHVDSVHNTLGDNAIAFNNTSIDISEFSNCLHPLSESTDAISHDVKDKTVIRKQDVENVLNECYWISPYYCGLWYKDDKPVKKASRVNIDADGFLVISKAKQVDSGVYEFRILLTDYGSTCDCNIMNPNAFRFAKTIIGISGRMITLT